MAKWWEEYKCGCISESVARKKDLPGYCAKHGDSSRGAQREVPQHIVEAYKKDDADRKSHKQGTSNTKGNDNEQ